MGTLIRISIALPLLIFVHSFAYALDSEWHWYISEINGEKWEFQQGVADVEISGNKLSVQFYVPKEVLPDEPKEAPKKRKGTTECLWPYVDGRKNGAFVGTIIGKNKVTGRYSLENPPDAGETALSGRMARKPNSEVSKELETILLSTSDGFFSLGLFRFPQESSKRSVELGHSPKQSKRLAPCPAWLK